MLYYDKSSYYGSQNSNSKYKLKTCYLQWWSHGSNFYDFWPSHISDNMIGEQDEYQQKEPVSPILHRTTAIEYECLFLETNQYCFCYPCYDGHVYYLGPHLQLYAHDQSFHKFHICVSICIRMLHRVESKTCISFVSFLVRFSFTTVTIFCWYSSLIVQPWCKIISQECGEFLQYVSWSTCHRKTFFHEKVNTAIFIKWLH